MAERAAPKMESSGILMTWDLPPAMELSESSMVKNVGRILREDVSSSFGLCLMKGRQLETAGRSKIHVLLLISAGQRGSYCKMTSDKRHFTRAPKPSREYMVFLRLNGLGECGGYT